MSISAALKRARYKYVPEHQIGELLLKPWIDTAIPAFLLAIVAAVFIAVVPDFLTLGNLSDTARQLGEIGFLTLGLTVVILSGGIDLSVGAIFGLCNFIALALMQYLGFPVLGSFLMTVAVGIAIGSINGFLVGYMRMRAFLTTLAVLIVGRAVLANLALQYGTRILNDPGDLDLWYFIGEGSILGIPNSLVLLIVVGIAAHLLLTRMKLGWHIQAIGGSRRSAYNAGLPVPSTILFCYAFSGACCGIAGFLYAARVANPDAEVGNGLEILALTAAVLGGNSLGGGRGSVAKAMLGTIIVILITNSIITLGLRSGGTNLVMGLVLLFAVVIDVRWIKNRYKILSRVYVSPTYFRMKPLPSTKAGTDTPLAHNNALSDAEPIGLGDLDGPEDVIFDHNDYLYTVSRHGELIRFTPPDYRQHEVFAHIGGQTLGLAVDAANTIYVCVSGMGLYSVGQDRIVRKCADQTARSLFSIRDDSRIRFADDLDFSPDGKLYFSEATIRFDIFDWASDSLEMRGNGRLLVYDPQTGRTNVVCKDLIFANGVCVETNGQSLLFAETWAARVNRYWFAGPKKGRIETVLDNLPGYPDNINRASDGNYWVALLGMRTPVHDLSMSMPDFRKRMAQRVAFDEWLYPNFNTGTVLKFSGDGTILKSLWDGTAERHSTITSMREHKGYLYLGGVFNNRIGRVRLEDADPSWTSHFSYWGIRG